MILKHYLIHVGIGGTLSKIISSDELHDFINNLDKESLQNISHFEIEYAYLDNLYDNDCYIIINVAGEPIDKAIQTIEKYLAVIKKYNILYNEDWVKVLNDTNKSPYNIFWIDECEDIDSLCKNEGCTVNEFFNSLTCYDSNDDYLIIDRTRYGSSKLAVYTACDLVPINFKAVLDYLIEKEESEG